MTGSSRYADGLPGRAAGVLPEAVLRYLRQGARDGVTASEATAA
jgi:4-hydroxymandelate oxidase